MSATQRSSITWQLILADLALILFLTTAAALTASKGLPGDTPDPPASPIPIAPAQSLYRAGAGLPTLAEWLARQPHDPRASLTIFAQHEVGEAERAWTEARAMTATASALGIRSRVVIREGDLYDIHASLAYDQPGP